MVLKNPGRVPEAVSGIQYNCCKTPNCSNFGVPVEEVAPRGTNNYTAVGVGRNNKGYRCNACGEHFVAKSNQAIYEEFLRLSKYLKPKQVCCPNTYCYNHTIPVGTKKAYRSFGTAKSGAKRYQCSNPDCRRTVSLSVANKGQHDTTHNEAIFKMLVNKVPFNRIVSMLGINWDMFYRRIDYIHKQCLDFAATQENELYQIDFDRLYLSVDRQNHSVNWVERKDKRNTILNAIATADNTTGYVFGVHPNFDMSVNRSDTQSEANFIGDEKYDPAFRKFARIWLDADYEKSLERCLTRNKKKVVTNLKDSIADKYTDVSHKKDTEESDLTGLDKLPEYGVQVKSEYTMFAHFLAIKELFGYVGKYRFFLDQDSGIRGAFMNAFKDEVKAKTADAFFVAIEKELTVDEKRKLKNDSNRKIASYLKANPSMTREEAQLALLKVEIQNVQPIGQWNDKWVHHPLPNMAEANKSMCWLTEDETMSLDHKAWLYNKASLHGVDSFFQKVRRRISMLERPIHSSSSTGRVWNGYGAYNPAMVGKLLDIFRVVHNYIDTKDESYETGLFNKKNGKPEKKVNTTTAAMRIGLTAKPYTYEEVLCFNQ